MRKILLFFAILLSFPHLVKAQCASNCIFTVLGLPAIPPSELEIPGVPIGQLYILQ